MSSGFAEESQEMPAPATSNSSGIVGGQVDTKLQSEYSGKRTEFLAYRSVISTARTPLEWLLRQLNEKV